MVDKMRDAIGALNKTTTAVSTVSMCYNMYLIKKVHYGGEIYTIDKRQERILKNIHKIGTSIYEDSADITRWTMT